LVVGVSAMTGIILAIFIFALVFLFFIPATLRTSLTVSYSKPI